jgi:hypothetical protein
MQWLLICSLLAQTTSATSDAATSAERAAVAAEKAAVAAQKAAEAAQKSAEAVAAVVAAKPAAAPAAAAAVVAPPPPDVVWSGTVGLGLIALTGNSQTITFSTNAAIERKSKEWIWGFKASAAYGQSETQTVIPATATTASTTTSTNNVTALNGTFQARGDRRFSDTTSLYLLAGVDTDHLQAIEARPYGELGVALIWFDQKVGDWSKTSLRTDLGFRYGREYRFFYYPVGACDGPCNLGEVDIVAPRLGVAYRYAISKDVIFTEDISAIGNVVNQARLLFTSTTKLASRLTEKVSLGVSFVVNDDTAPVAGKVSTDTALSVGLEVGL